MNADSRTAGTADSDDLVKVVYVCCHGRSGSTLLGAVAGLMPQHSFVGEVRTIWDDGIRDNHNCGCGVPFRSCHFWIEVFERAFGGFDSPTALAAGALLSRHMKVSSKPALWLALLRNDRQHALTCTLARALEPLYRAIHGVSGGHVIVDTSKHARFGFIVSNIPGVDVRFVNMIRDVRGVVYSRAKPALMRDGSVRHAGHSRRRGYMIGQILGRWLLRNSLASLLMRRHGGVRTLYEEFVRDQLPTLESLSDTASAQIALQRLASSQAAAPIVQHQLAGNWIRNMQIDTREAWPTALPPLVRGITTFLSWPLRRRYRFAVWPPSGFATGPDARQEVRAAR